MDSIGDYIYLIIIILAGLSSLFKKKKQTTKPVAQEEEPVFELPDVLKDVLYPGKKKFEPEVIFEMPQTKPVKQEKNYDFTQTSQETLKSYENISNFSELKAKKSVSKMPHKQTFKEGVDEEITSSDLAFSSIEDVRKAFIASEVFNRKY